MKPLKGALPYNRVQWENEQSSILNASFDFLKKILYNIYTNLRGENGTRKITKIILDKSDIMEAIAEKYGVNEWNITLKVSTDPSYGDTSITAEIE